MPTSEFKFLCEIFNVKQEMTAFDLQHWNSLMLMSFDSFRQKNVSKCSKCIGLIK